MESPIYLPSFPPQDKIICDYFEDMGFSSSSMFNSDKEELKKFFDELELSQEDKEMTIILFVLGYIAADGCVKWIYAAAGYQDLEDGYTIQFDCASCLC